MKHQRFQKTYLSRAMTRAMAVDHPIGDPHGGPAYGELNEPVSAIIAVGSMIGSAAGAGALVAGTVTLGTVAAGLAFAGAAVSLVGNITGNKNLMKIGAVAGMIGGLGMGVDALGNWLSGAGAVTEEAAQVAAQSGVDGMAAADVAGVSDAIVDVNPAQETLASTATAVTPSAPAMDTASLLSPADGLQSAAPVNMYDLQSAAPVNMYDLPSSTPPVNMYDDAVMNSQGILNNATKGGVGSAFSGESPYTQIASNGAPGQPGSGWQYFSNDAGQAVAISPDGTYFANTSGNGMQQITGAQGQQMGLLDKTGNLLGQGWRWMTDPANAQATSVISQAVGGATKIFGPEGKYYDASTNLHNAQADQVRYQTRLAQERRDQLNRNLNSYVAQPIANPNAVTITPPGLINTARGG